MVNFKFTRRNSFKKIHFAKQKNDPMNIIFKKDTWQEIYYSLKNNKLRTFLTMIGVGWGMFLFVRLLGAAKVMENWQTTQAKFKTIHGAIPCRCSFLTDSTLSVCPNYL